MPRRVLFPHLIIENQRLKHFFAKVEPNAAEEKAMNSIAATVSEWAPAVREEVRLRKGLKDVLPHCGM